MHTKFLAQTLNIIDPDVTGNVTPSLSISGRSNFNTIADLVNAVLHFLFPLALFIAFVYFVWAGWDLIQSMGNPEGMKKAQAKITNAVLGLILLGISYWMAQIVVRIFF
ncbi:MAG: hypothetical protein NUV65_04685 [Candidatus Roizmanbacteria bacterium]|nr:hypothetical protein [Candidatus Roizmanbacteria bacterium]